MSKPIPSIRKWMTENPTVVEKEATLERAHAVMRAERIRHLPVVEDGRLVGLVSITDLHLIESLRDVDVKVVQVGDAMTENPYSISPDAPLDEIASELAERKIGSAVVVQNDKIVGIFSAVDALRACAELLRTRLAN